MHRNTLFLIFFTFLLFGISAPETLGDFDGNDSREEDALEDLIRRLEDILNYQKIQKMQENSPVDKISYRDSCPWCTAGRWRSNKRIGD